MDKQEKNNLLVWLIVIVMLGSTLGYALLSSGYFKENKQETNQEENTSSINFKASDVNAVVKEIYNSMIFLAYTDLELKDADSKIYSVDGIKKVSSTWMPESSSGLGNPIYRANIIFSKRDPYDLYSELSKISDFKQSTAYLNALVELPKVITIYNKDLNMQREYTLNDQLVNAIISIESKKGDLLLVSVDLSLSGSKEKYLSCIETANLSARPKMFLKDENFTISTIKPVLNINAVLKLSKANEDINLEKLIDDINSFENVLSTNLRFSNPSNYFVISLDSNYESLQSDLNSALYGINGVSNVSFYPSSQEILIDYNTNNFMSLKQSIEEIITSFNFKIKDFDEPSYTLLGDLNTDSVEHNLELSEKIFNLLNERNFESKIMQYATFDVNYFYSENGEKHILEDGNFSALVKPSHNVGDLANLYVQYYVVRDKIVYINAKEKE
ncbi:MAG: hypothetical protein N3D73_02390 [Candidatus Diapherotrites archaeon]|nr:hypothetical protein [Candidatus Diapherotrites archaeon]